LPIQREKNVASCALGNFKTVLLPDDI
jgi:hypothetical protein